MMTESPINSANDLMRSIASAMDALRVFWKDYSPTAGNEAGIRNTVDFIDANYAVLRDLEPQVRQYVEDAWNENEESAFQMFNDEWRARKYVVLCHESLDYFIRFTQPISPRVKWLGSRAEAVIFAEEFGLTAKDMNRSFIIPSRSGGHRDLNLAGDTPTNKKDQYPVWKAISEYKSML